jgi:hypothetical protein
LSIFDQQRSQETRKLADRNSPTETLVDARQPYQTCSDFTLDLILYLTVEDEMTTWLTEKEYRQSGATAVGMTINVAFLEEIKTDFDFRSTLNKVYQQVNQRPNASAPDIARWLSQLRDQLETYFALEEFYGYLEQDEVTNIGVSKMVAKKTKEHESLFLQLSAVVDVAEQIVYHECSSDLTIIEVRSQFHRFCEALADHEQDEMELIMQMFNEDIGVGD